MVLRECLTNPREASGLDPEAVHSDPSNGVAERYGLVHDVDGMTGIEEPVPAMFLLEAGGVISDSWVADEWPEQPPYDRIDEWIK